MSADAIRLSPRDTVATALRDISAAETVHISDTETIVASERIPLCHKIALHAMQPHAHVLKYGEVIGEATAPIAAGAHVHVHNMRSLRGRGPG